MNYVAIIISIITIAILLFNNEILKPLLSRRSSVPIPIELIAVVGGTLIAKIFDFEHDYNLKTVGHIPQGFPDPHMSDVSIWRDLLFDSFAIAFVSYSVTVSMALIFAQKEKYEIDFNQELLAMVIWRGSDLNNFCDAKKKTFSIFTGSRQHSRFILLVPSVLSVIIPLADSAFSWRQDSACIAHILHASRFCVAVDWAVFWGSSKGERENRVLRKSDLDRCWMSMSFAVCPGLGCCRGVERNVDANQRILSI